MVALRPPKEPGWLKQQIEGALKLIPWRFAQDLRIKTADKFIYLFNDARIQSGATAITASLMPMLLVLPVLTCYVLVTKVSSSKGYGGCTGCFFSSLLFSPPWHSSGKQSDIRSLEPLQQTLLISFANIARSLWCFWGMRRN
ncbi:hypothetical protein K432DRAFT_448797, partial [Lepidopterella palustris CBS 459.81]